jgi:dTDP-4-dehydrorhamnose 3,5-epimerase
MNFAELPILGAWTIEPSPHVDHRGSFYRAWCIEEFSAHGLDFVPLQANMGTSHVRGTIRGLHYQTSPHEEAKLVRCTRGAVFDVVVDVRPGSPTFGRWASAELSAKNGRMLFVPRGCATGYQTLEDESDVYYLTSAVYAPGAVRGLRYDDPTVGITWPFPPSAISEQDTKWPSLEDHLLAQAR